MTERRPVRAWPEYGDKNYVRDFEGQQVYYVIDKVQTGTKKIVGAPGVDCALFLDYADAKRHCADVRSTSNPHVEVRCAHMPYMQSEGN